MLSELIDLVPLPDILAIIWLVVWWSGYAALNCNPQTNRRELARVIDGYRHRWMERMLERDNRMADVNIIIAHIRSGALFASTTVLILAGIVALWGNVDRLIVMIDELAFSTLASRQLIELKVQTMMAIFAYGFFKFAWCLRQYNTALVVIGAAPLPAECDDETRTQYPARAASILTRAAGNFNRGLNAYYFGLATLAWFIQPVLFMVAVLLVIVVLYRRDRHSVTLKALS